jgi:hypothetical protein
VKGAGNQRWERKKRSSDESQNFGGIALLIDECPPFSLFSSLPWLVDENRRGERKINFNVLSRDIKNPADT